MKNILWKLLERRKINSLDELSPEEKKTFEDWDKVLSKDELTLEDVKHFCSSQVELIENKWKDYTLRQSEKAELIPYHTCYKTLLQAIDSPKSQRELLEKQLNNLINVPTN